MQGTALMFSVCRRVCFEISCRQRSRAQGRSEGKSSQEGFRSYCTFISPDAIFNPPVTIFAHVSVFHLLNSILTQAGLCSCPSPPTPSSAAPAAAPAARPASPSSACTACQAALSDLSKQPPKKPALPPAPPLYGERKGERNTLYTSPSFRRCKVQRRSPSRSAALPSFLSKHIPANGEGKGGGKRQKQTNATVAKFCTLYPFIFTILSWLKIATHDPFITGRTCPEAAGGALADERSSLRSFYLSSSPA